MWCHITATWRPLDLLRCKTPYFLLLSLRVHRWCRKLVSIQRQLIFNISIVFSQTTRQSLQYAGKMERHYRISNLDGKFLWWITGSKILSFPGSFQLIFNSVNSDSWIFFFKYCLSLILVGYYFEVILSFQNELKTRFHCSNFEVAYLKKK